MTRRTEAPPLDRIALARAHAAQLHRLWRDAESSSEREAVAGIIYELTQPGCTSSLTDAAERAFAEVRDAS